jgi:formylglycine-generating enzyme required for sulfatase activity
LGPISGSTRVYRVGAYHNPAASIRTVMRGSRSESHANVDIGFRCVLDVPAD